MRTFIQLVDNIGYAVIRTQGEVDHTTTPENITAVEVFSDNPDQFLKMKYEGPNSWTPAPVIVYADVDANGEILELRRTVWASEVGSNPVYTNECKPNSKWLNGSWVHVESVVPIEPTVAPVIVEEVAQTEG